MLISNKKTTVTGFTICYFVKKKKRKGKLPLASCSMIHFSLAIVWKIIVYILDFITCITSCILVKQANQNCLIIYSIVIFFHLMTKELLY
jgi:hypothetical protein